MIWRFLIARMIQVRVIFKIMEETVFTVFRSEMVKSNNQNVDSGYLFDG